MKPKVIYDTNVIVSAALNRKEHESTPALLVRLARQGNVRLFVSPEILEEYARVLRKPALRMSPQRIGVFLSALQRVAVVVKPTKRYTVARVIGSRRALTTVPAQEGFLAPPAMRVAPRWSASTAAGTAPCVAALKQLFGETFNQRARGGHCESSGFARVPRSSLTA